MLRSQFFDSYGSTSHSRLSGYANELQDKAGLKFLLNSTALLATPVGGGGTSDVSINMSLIML